MIHGDPCFDESPHPASSAIFTNPLARPRGREPAATERPRAPLDADPRRVVEEVDRELLPIHDAPAFFADAPTLKTILLEQHKHHETRMEGLLREHERRLTDAVCELLRSRPGQPAQPLPPAFPLRLPTAPIKTRSGSELTRVLPTEPEKVLPTEPEKERTGHPAWEPEAPAMGHAKSVSSTSPQSSHSKSKWNKLGGVVGLGLQKKKCMGLFEQEDQNVLRQMNQIRDEVTKKSPRIIRKSMAVGHTISRSSIVAQKVYESRKFEYSVCFLIIANASLIGAEAHWRMANLYDEQLLFFRICDILFTTLFASELVVRLMAEGLAFFSVFARNAKWNLFDSTLVLSSILEEMLNAFFAEDSPDVSAIRLLRLLRLVRVVRVIRVMRFFKDLRVMVAGILSSVKSLVWAMVLLSLIMYIFGVLFMQVLAEAIVRNDMDYERVAKHYGTMHATIYTLYMSISGGLDWSDVAEPLFEANPLVGACFALYIAFGVFCVLNIITGVFVENANHITSKDEDNMIMDQLVHRREWLQEIKFLFTNIGASKTGELRYADFEKNFHDARVQAYFRKCGVDVDVNSAPAIFSLFDFNKDGSIDTEEFLSGISQIHGHARAIDLCKLQHETKDLKIKLSKLLSLLVSGPDDAGRESEQLFRGQSDLLLQHGQSEFFGAPQDTTAET